MPSNACSEIPKYSAAFRRLNNRDMFPRDLFISKGRLNFSPTPFHTFSNFIVDLLDFFRRFLPGGFSRRRSLRGRRWRDFFAAVWWISGFIEPFYHHPLQKL